MRHWDQWEAAACGGSPGLRFATIKGLPYSFWTKAIPVKITWRSWKLSAKEFVDQSPPIRERRRWSRKKIGIMTNRMWKKKSDIRKELRKRRWVGEVLQADEELRFCDLIVRGYLLDFINYFLRINWNDVSPLPPCSINVMYCIDRFSRVWKYFAQPWANFWHVYLHFSSINLSLFFLPLKLLPRLNHF